MGATARVMIINYVVAENMHAKLMSEHNCLIQSEVSSYSLFFFRCCMHFSFQCITTTAAHKHLFFPAQQHNAASSEKIDNAKGCNSKRKFSTLKSLIYVFCSLTHSHRCAHLNCTVHTRHSEYTVCYDDDKHKKTPRFNWISNWM